MTLSWQADKKYVDHFLQASGFSGSQIKKIWFGKYVQYWSGETIMRTQREWSMHFANHMQSYLLRPDFFEEVNGMLDEGKKQRARKNNAKAFGATATSRKVPMLSDGAQLQTWAMTQGLPAAPVGITTTQYYQLLCNAVERQQIRKEKNTANKVTES
jgi:hypothetical protein